MCRDLRCLGGTSRSSGSTASGSAARISSRWSSSGSGSRALLGNDTLGSAEVRLVVRNESWEGHLTVVA